MRMHRWEYGRCGVWHVPGPQGLGPSCFRKAGPPSAATRPMMCLRNQGCSGLAAGPGCFVEQWWETGWVGGHLGCVPCEWGHRCRWWSGVPVLWEGGPSRCRGETRLQPRQGGGGAVHTAASLFQQPVTWAVRTEGQAAGQSVAGGWAGGGFDGLCLSFREHRFPVEALGSGLQPGGAAQLARETRVGSGWDVPGQREH